MTLRAVVFAYHQVGVRCLQVLLARGVEVTLVVTHPDNPAENIWFDSVAALATEHRLPTLMPTEANSSELNAAVRAAKPDFIFSFYYRHMLSPELLALASHGAFNLHGSLLPKYRGRAPVNWAILHGATETGATLHEMTAKPDAGAIIAQTAVPILPDDTATQVFDKVTVAAEQTLWKSLPALLSGAAPRLPNILANGSYFGGRKPEDGRINWLQPAQTVYNLIRAVAPPYPGAFTEIKGKRFVIARARLASIEPLSGANLAPGLQIVDNALFGLCGDGRAIAIHALQHAGRLISLAEFAELTHT